MKPFSYLFWLRRNLSKLKKNARRQLPKKPPMLHTGQKVRVIIVKKKQLTRRKLKDFEKLKRKVEYYMVSQDIVCSSIRAAALLAADEESSAKVKTASKTKKKGKDDFDMLNAALASQPKTKAQKVDREVVASGFVCGLTLNLA